MCGTMIPTKPISPVTATAAAVPSVAATTRASRTRRTSTPRLAASSSPRLSTSTTRRSARITIAATATYGRIRTTSDQPGARDVPEDPRVDLLQRLRVLLLDERLPGGEERGHRHAGQDQRRRVALAPRRAADRVREHDRDGAADERGDGQHPLPAQPVREVRDRDRRAEPGAGGDAEEVRIRERIAEDALVGRAREREHRADERGEDDARHADLPEDRLLGRGERRRDAGNAEPRRRSTRAPPRRRGRPARRGRRRRARTTRKATAEHTPSGLEPAGADLGGVLRDGRHRYWRSRASADDIARKKSTSRGPQREAIESWTRTIEPVRTALIRSQPGRDATVDGFWPQHTVSARTIRSGLADDDVLRGELRVAEAGAVGGVGDVPEAERRVDLPDERLRRRRVEVGRQLVVDGQPAARLLRVGDDLRDPRLHRGDQPRRPRLAAGDEPELADLLVRALEALGAVLVEHGDAEPVERSREALRVVRDDDEIGPVRRDRLDVRA